MNLKINGLGLIYSMEEIWQYFQENPKIFGITLIIIGVILFIFTLLTNANKLLHNTTNRYRIKDFANIFGGKAGGIAAMIFYYIMAISFIIAGIVFIII
jgi:hypothetical protein